MKHYRVVIIGGGPAGAACAGRLVKGGLDCLVLDKEIFPRQKICAGWIQPDLFQKLGVQPGDYPGDLTTFSSLKIYLHGFPITHTGIQYAVRRIEFDYWLLSRSLAPYEHHEVKKIQKNSRGFIIDNQYSADYLIGAGGTHCPVYHTFFKGNQDRSGARIVAQEAEYRANWQDPGCRLWFFENGLPGYFWYVPKKGGYLNIGVGGNTGILKMKGSTIKEHWNFLVDFLQQKGLVEEPGPEPHGYIYSLRGRSDRNWKDNIYLIGDSAGLATLDMGEGIGPAVQSGLLAAEAILENREYSLEGISKYSLLPKGLRWMIN